MATATDTTRNATLIDLGQLLSDQHSRKVDIVAPARAIRSEGGLLVVEGTDPVITEAGVTAGDGRYRPTRVADEGVASKLGIPLAYLRRLREERPDLYDANVNGWLHGVATSTKFLDGTVEEGRRLVDPRKFLLRTFRTDETGEGVARAFLSDTYKVIDNLDVLTAVLEGIRASGLDIGPDDITADLSERRMYLKVTAHEVAELAPELLAGYRSPFTGASGSDNPTVFAGFVVSNSEVGGGAFTITPRLTVLVCDNGMTLTKDALRNVHLGSKLDEGVVRWSEETQAANLDLIKNQATDAVRTFLDVDYVRAKIGQLTEAASKDVKVDEVETITKGLAYPEERRAAVLDAFVRGGQVTVGGVAQAISAAAKGEEDADIAAQLESDAASLLIG